MARLSKEAREFDQSAHPTTHRTSEDLVAPGAASDMVPISDDDDANLHRAPTFAALGKSREMHIAEVAYARAESRDFAAGYELDDWLAAEKEVDQGF